MTEMLHISLSNRPGQVRAGTTGMAVLQEPAPADKVAL